jgi:cytochrome c oxidase subunit 2
VNSSPAVKRNLLRLTALLGLAALLTGCVTEGPRSTLNPAGPVARQQMELFDWTLWLSIAVLAIVIGVLIYAIIRFRKKPTGDPDAIPNQVHGSVPLEITWTLIPVIVVVLIAVPTVRAIFETETRVTPTDADLIVNVTGYQFWWRFEYPDLGIVTANELHIPVGKRIILNLDTADVIHSFWTPKLAGKRDMIPNQDNQLWFSAEEPGPYWGHCAEYCGVAHAYMRYRVIVDTPEDFERWVASFQEPSADAPEQDDLAQRGKEVYARRGCIGCHTIDNYAEGYEIGNPDYPNLTNFGLRNTVGAGVLENTPENLARWIADPQDVKPGNFMPDLFAEDDAQAEEEVRALVAYLESLGRQ